MEDLHSEGQQIPSNEKSCQTDELCHEATVPGPDQASRTPAYSHEPGDPALLQRPMQTSKSGIQQILECLRSGTAQLKHMLIKEVNTIFECKVCRSLFRGLPNLITHKEYYCFSSVPEPYEHLGNGRQSQAIKELLEAIYPRPDRQDYVMRLEPIEGNQNAVFQYLSKEDDLDLPSYSQSSNHGTDDWPRSAPESQLEDRDKQHTEGEGEVDAEGEQTREKEGDGCIENEPEAGEKKVAEMDEEKMHSEDTGEEEAATGDVEGTTITCCLCGKDFNTRRTLRRHCRKMHRRRLEELRKFTETRTVPISLLSVVKGQQVGRLYPSTLNGKHCPVCFKVFATKANVRRHFDEVHRGLRRDFITPDIATKPGQLEATSVQCIAASPTQNGVSLPLPQYNLDSLQCLLCKRTYSTQVRLKRHMHIVHKILTSKGAIKNSAIAKRPKGESDNDSSKLLSDLQLVKREHGKRPREDDEEGSQKQKPKLALGFDFKQLFCKLCKRQFSSQQNLTKHIELHTDNGSDIFIKFYRCPHCRYESRRKRDVLRHISVVHKKNSAYLAKILPNLESRAVKKPAEVVLNVPVKRGHPKLEVNGCHKPSPRKADPPKPAPYAARQPDLPPPSPPVTRKQSLIQHRHPATRHQNSHKAANEEKARDSTEVRVTKNFSLHGCDMCGRAFAKKVYLESHKRSHRNATSNDGRAVGMSTRSKSLLW